MASVDAQVGEAVHADWTAMRGGMGVESDLRRSPREPLELQPLLTRAGRLIARAESTSGLVGVA